MKVLLCMIFLHLIDDYKLQGILASFKQKEWWKQNAPDEKYKYDYIVALFEHAFMNSFMIHIPIYLWVCKNELALTITVIISTFLHAIVDDGKANKKIYNLFQDQFTHILWIINLFLIFYAITGRI